MTLDIRESYDLYSITAPLYAMHRVEIITLYIIQGVSFRFCLRKVCLVHHGHFIRWRQVGKDLVIVRILRQAVRVD